MYNDFFEKMSQILVKYSLDVKPDEHVWLTGDLAGMPLYDAIYKQLILQGAEVTATFISQSWEEIFYTYASSKQCQKINPTAEFLTNTVDKRIRIIAPSNTRVLSGMDSKKLALASQSRAPLLKKTMERSAQGELGWVVSLCPTQALAQEANRGFEQYAQFVFKACFLEKQDPIVAWKELEKKQEVMIAYLEKKKQLHFKTSAGTDLVVNIEGMRWKNSCGHRNFPDGEVFTGPNLEASDGGVNGVVRYTFPAIWQHTVVEDVQLVFEKGRVISATASKNQSFLQAMLQQDEGASKLGEIAIGTNDQITDFTSNILFDEKIGGTFHAALGMGYPETGNKNQSALHWDMICDLREGGEIWADGELISKDGHFQLPGWPSRR